MDAFRKAIIHVHVAAVSDVHRFPANHHDFSPRVIASMYASMSAMLRAINHDFSVSRICGFQCRRLDSNQQPPSNGLLPPSYNGANVAADYSPVTLPGWFADYIYASLRWDAGERLTATREGSSTTCKPHPWGRLASQVCPKCRRLASNQRPPRLQLGALANWATTALLVIVIIWWTCGQ